MKFWNKKSEKSAEAETPKVERETSEFITRSITIADSYGGKHKYINLTDFVNYLLHTSLEAKIDTEQGKLVHKIHKDLAEIMTKW